MKKLFSLLLLSLLVQSVWSQSGEGYDPENPGDPDVYYILTLEAAPLSGGTVSPSTRQKLSAGQSTYISASPRLGYEFKRWMMGDSLVSTEKSHYFTMPEKDVVLTAYFEWNPVYDPQNPGDPDAEGYRHHVYAYAMPSAGGYFNSSSFTLVEGSTTNIYAYPREGYRFESWMCNGEVVSTDNPLQIRMGTEDIAYTATFVYNPVPPGEPSPNVFNTATGEVVIDNFTPGSLNSAIYSAVGSSDNYDAVQRITVIGRMQGSDFGFARSYKNCSLIDLSRTTGYTEVPSYSFEGAEALKELYLPMNVERIGENAFNGCTALKDIYLYATTPPSLAENALNGLGKNVNLYVPSASVALYAAAEGWNQLNIQSLNQNEKSITVSLPGEAGTYKNMTLELQNVQSGQVYRCLVTDRTSYTFFGLMKNTYYNIYLKNSNKVVLGEINNVALEDGNLNVSFESIKTMQNVTLSVLTPEGKNVTADVTITWLDELGSYLRQGNQVSELLTGTNIQYRVKLSKDLALEYVQPADMTYEVKAGENDVVFTLSPIKQITLSGCVVDAATKQGISGATVSISQTLNGKYSKTIIAKTDNKGIYTATVYNAPTSLAISAYDYVNQTKDVSIDPESESVSVENIAMNSIIGATINVNLTYTPSVAEGETAETQNWYSDYQNVAYSIYNVTTGKEVTQVSIRYPQLVILDGASIGDSLEIKAVSKKNAFKEVPIGVKVNTTSPIDIVFPIKEFGGINSHYKNNENAEVVGMLYDGSGYLKKIYDYVSDAKLSISELPDGSYTLVTMAKSSTYNSIYSLTRLKGILLEGVDYQQSQYSVESGLISTSICEQVPYFDEDKFKYIDKDKSYFNVDNTSIVAGNYLTFTGHLETKDVDLSSLKDIKYIVDLPPSAIFVENSVMIGGNIVNDYTLEGNTLTISCPQIPKDKVKFCVIPTERGRFLPNAIVAFTIGEKETMLSIGCSPYEVKDMSISVPPIVCSPDVIVSGTSSVAATIDIYDDEILIGQTSSTGNGRWSCNATLDNPYNLSTHNIYAIIYNDKGYHIKSETRVCLYDKEASIDISKVTMYHWNPEVNGWKGQNYEVVFDFQNPDNVPASYVYYIYNKKFTFTIDFTINDPNMISNVVLYVKTGNGTWTPLNANYDELKCLWVAEGEFGNMYDGNIPVNVAVDYQCNSRQFYIDNTEIGEADKYIDGLKDNIQSSANEVESLLFELFQECEKEYPNTESINYLSEKIYEVLGLSHEDDGQTNIESQESLQDELDLIDAFFSNGINAGVGNILDSDLSQLLNYQNLLDGIIIKDTHDLNEESLINDGFERRIMSDSSYIYVLSEKESYQYVNFQTGKYIIIDMSSNESLSKFFAPGNKSNIDKVIEGIDYLIQKYNEFNDGLQNVNHYLEAFQAFAEATLKTSKSNFTKALHNYLDLVNIRMEGKSLPFHGTLERGYKQVAQKSGKIMQGSRKLVSWLKDSNAAKIGGKIVSAFNILGNITQAIDNLKQVVVTYNSVPSPCENDSENANSIKDEVAILGLEAFTFYSLNIAYDIIALKAAIASAAALVPSEGISSIGLIAALGKIGLGIVLDKGYEWGFKNNLNALNSRIPMLKCKKEPEPEPEPKGKESGNEDSKNTIDPSGYVYEGVSSNRLEGVTATAYYMKTSEDIYGVIHNEPMVWDAEEYDQENPLFTDENGFYQWFVPQGLWQVKFEKEGYETTYSEWLPVPPPQLEVNIGMVQSRQPEVKQAHAYKDGIEVEFDKYMQPALLNAENIFVSQHGEYVEGEVKLLNEETAYADENVKYASKVRFVPTTPFTASEVTLTVANRVKSYAGLQMQDSYQQTFDIEQELTAIKADSVAEVAYEGTLTLAVQVLPAEASAGKTLRVKTSSPMIASVESETLVLDKDGKANVVVTGELPGSASLAYTIDGYDLTAQTIVKVNIVSIEMCAAPKASIASGSVVDKGTQIELSCDTEGATIYYTTDGSCPCDEAGSRMVYDGTPIVINKTTTVKAMAVAPGMNESEVTEFVYTVIDYDGIHETKLNNMIQLYPLPVRDILNVTAGGEMIKSVTISTMNGVPVASVNHTAKIVTLDTSSMSTGIYIVTIVTENGACSRKTQKIQ